MVNDLLLFLAGIAAGLLGYLVGLASLVSYPVMVALGVPPVVANASNTVALVPGGLGAVLTSWDRLKAVRTYPWGGLIGAVVVGGAVGAALLLLAPATAFQAVVPWLVLLATVLIAAGPRIQRHAGRFRLGTATFVVLLTVVSVYGGYFGAGSGVMFLALCALGSPLTTHESVLLKTPLLEGANLIASVLFIAAGRVDWAAAVAVGVGSFIGGLVGPGIQKRIPERTMRLLVVLGGVALTVWLFVQA